MLAPGCTQPHYHSVKPSAAAHTTTESVSDTSLVKMLSSTWPGSLAVRHV